MKKLLFIIFMCSSFTTIFSQDINFTAFEKWGDNGPVYGFKDAKGDIVLEPCFTGAGDVKNNFAAVSLTPAGGPQTVKEYFIIGFTSENIINYDTLVFRAYENFGKGFIKASNINTNGNTAQLTHTGSRVGFGNTYWGLFYKGKLILEEKYSKITLGDNRIDFSNGGIENGYVTFDGKVTFIKKQE
jgi:hypothetical protein